MRGATGMLVAPRWFFNMNDPSKSAVMVRVAAVLGALVVAIGAFGAHGLKDTLVANNTEAIWDTAVFYHAVHAVALLALALAGRAGALISGCWVVGIIIFSGSLYVLAITDLRWLGAITPFGGVALIAGWVVLVFSKK